MDSGADLSQIIVQKILQEIKRTSSPVLPSIKELAAKFAVSASIVARAARILRDRSIVTFTRGQRIHIPGRSKQIKKTARIPSTVSLAGSLRELIGAGKLRAGQPLPKISTIALEYNVSNTTVLNACRSLLKENLIHKKGKMWIVGSDPLDLRRLMVRGQPPVIILLQNRERVWSSLARSSRTARFCYQFDSEAARFGIQTLSAFADEQHAPQGAICTGRDQLHELIRKLDSRYLGTLILSSLIELPDIVSWIGDLTVSRKPVVWLDKYDEKLPEKPSTPLFTRCHFSELQATRLAAEFLAGRGHQIVTYPHVSNSDWQTKRGELLEQAAQETGIRVCPIEQVAIVSSDSISPRKPAMLTPLFREILKRSDSTAIIAPYDYAAYYYYHWLSLNQVKVPDQISLISFDNYPSIYSLPITTVDFGFGYLGYAAFHLLFGLIPIRRSRTGDVPSKPEIVDRGSVGPPRRHPIRIQLSPDSLKDVSESIEHITDD